jgi:hypothetical protein
MAAFAEQFNLLQGGGQSYPSSLSSRVSDLDVLREREVNNVKHSVILQVLVLYL